MTQEYDFLFDSMESVFSPLEPEEIAESAKDVVLSYVGDDRRKIDNVTWAEFDANGDFVRGGVSDAELMTCRIVVDWATHATIADIVELIRNEVPRPGKLIPFRDGEAHVWCVPYRSVGPATVPMDRTRAILLTEDLFFAILELFNADADLTRAEKRIVYQIVIGLNPGAAASADNVSIETKRTQLKSAASKLMCHGQSELIRYLVTQLIQLLFLCESESTDISVLEAFSARFFGQVGRLSVQRLPSARVIRYWEFGPSHGRPIIVLHGYLFPFLFLQAEPELRKHRLRLIIPIRRGYMDNQSITFNSDTLQLAYENISDIIDFVEHNVDQEIPILGHNTGGVYAIALASKRPDLFSQLLICSINLLGEDDARPTTSRKFANGLKKLAKNSGIYELAARKLQSIVLRTEHASKIVLRRLFKDSPADLDVVEGRIGPGPAFDWFRQITLNSALGFASDISLVSTYDRRTFDGLNAPIAIIHGTHDPYTDGDELMTLLSARGDKTVDFIENGGHYASASHPQMFWELVARHLD